jgi:predicted Rossmann fold nucleotide-binding protein DprA/Smf involved in DNA uptake
MANELAILSGLAQGIDATAHITAVNAHYKRCIGVIGNGMNKPLNNSQQSLHGQILAMGGLIISEYPAHYPVAKEQLVARNRIQAILSNVVIVIEATLASGTAHTVRFASQVDTPVCAITINGIEQIPEHALLSSIPNSFKLSQRDLIRRFLSTYVKVKP